MDACSFDYISFLSSKSRRVSAYHLVHTISHKLFQRAILKEVGRLHFQHFFLGLRTTQMLGSGNSCRHLCRRVWSAIPFSVLRWSIEWIIQVLPVATLACRYTLVPVNTFHFISSFLSSLLQVDILLFRVVLHVQLCRVHSCSRYLSAAQQPWEQLSSALHLSFARVYNVCMCCFNQYNIPVFKSVHDQTHL